MPSSREFVNLASVLVYELVFGCLIITFLFLKEFIFMWPGFFFGSSFPLPHLTIKIIAEAGNSLRERDDEAEPLNDA